MIFYKLESQADQMQISKKRPKEGGGESAGWKKSLQGTSLTRTFTVKKQNLELTPSFQL